MTKYLSKTESKLEYTEVTITVIYRQTAELNRKNKVNFGKSTRFIQLQDLHEYSIKFSLVLLYKTIKQF